MTHQDALNIAAQAWEQVKPEDDPPFERCVQGHQFRLADKVREVAKGGNPDDDFDRAVQAILNPPQEAASDAEHPKPKRSKKKKTD